MKKETKFVISADVTCDLDKEIRDRFDVEYLPGHIVDEKGNDLTSDLDWKLYKDSDEVYKTLKKGPVLSTSPASVIETELYFESFLKEGKDVIHLALSSGLSGSFHFALQAKELALQNYPDGKIHVVDTLRYSTSIGLLAAKASELRSEGKTFEEVVDFLEKHKNEVHEMGPMDDLMFLSKKGRISRGKAFMGTLIGIKPMGDFNRQGLTTVLGKAKGLEKAIAATVKYIKATIVNPEEQILWISNTNRKKEAAMLKAAVEKEIKCREIISLDCHPASAVNIGPGLYACYYFGSEISENNEKEQALMNEILK